MARDFWILNAPADARLSELDPAQPMYRLDPRLLVAETIGRLRRANDGLRQVESGEWAKTYGTQGMKIERWIGLVRHEVAQAAMDLETLFSRMPKEDSGES